MKGKQTSAAQLALWFWAALAGAFILFAVTGVSFFKYFAVGLGLLGGIGIWTAIFSSSSGRGDGGYRDNDPGG